MSARSRFLLAATAALSLGLPTALAGDPTEDTYMAYHRAIRAAVHCLNDDKEFDQPQQAKLGAVIEQKIDSAIATGRRLTLIEQVRSEMRDTVAKYGCASDKVKPSLDLYQAELAGAL